MPSNPDTIRIIDEQILRSDDAICRHIDNLDFLGRGAVSQDILINLRTFIEHAMYKVYAHAKDVEYDYHRIGEAVHYVRGRGQLRFLWRFHDYLQVVASHYTLDPEDSERAMLKYYEFILRTRKYLKDTFGLSVLANLDKFPLDTDKTLQEYYERISEKLIVRDYLKDMAASEEGWFYVYKIKPFFVNQQIYYEVTFSPTIDKASKFDRITAFTTLDISRNYAVKLWTVKDNVNILSKSMPFFVIVDWMVAIRPIEVERFSRILNEEISNYAKSAEMRGLMEFLTKEGYNLVELICFDESRYQHVRAYILASHKAKVSRLFDLFDRCREIINKNIRGSNILRYLLYCMNNEIIKKQYAESNPKLSHLCLDFKCIPFDEMPFCTSPRDHNPRLGDLFDCIDSSNRKHELLARRIINNTMRNGQIYTPRAELEQFGDISILVEVFNRKLYGNTTQQARRIKERNGHLYIREYESDTVEIIKRLDGLSAAGLPNHVNFVDGWLASSDSRDVDCEEKKAFLRQMFTKSSIALIYGSAGTGKSTLIDHISCMFKHQSKLFLAN